LQKKQKVSKPKQQNHFPKAALDEIPTPGPDAVSITGLVKSSSRISGYQ